MEYKVRRADTDDHDDVEHLHTLHRATFTEGEPVSDAGGIIFQSGAWWLMYPDDHVDQPMGFCGVVETPHYYPASAYLKRAGILKEHRGQGLQLKLIRVRERWARTNSFTYMITNAMNDNVASANTLIRAGYRLWWPQVPWDLKAALYFRKRLQAL